MIKKIGLLTALVTILMLLLFLYGFTRSNQRAVLERTHTVTINNATFTVELANTEEKRRAGLSERDTLCATCGMLFVFPEKTKASFWMKGMRFNLDMLWLNDGTVVHIEKDIPYNSQDIFTPSAKSDVVLEINAGLSDFYRITTGDKAIFK